ncbi:cell surface glycoprotein CD200 receptor 1-A isoform X2 [Archocentrus centrarchus]|uniref:cell surface glycoprotein CD200 receptor 1-A isoform X2 n=1 Tax=Archocentrus centrarchus TaxID=63155 RepID=UPI0011EA1267|nr:cell surface glycoprotein CD200 receptor 1 isoform X2 [Archocentrus centrarchus]
MRAMMWMYLVILFLSEARSMESDYRNEVFSNGSDVNLTCSDKLWNETFYVLWDIKLVNKKCMIKFNIDGQNIDSCKDGKSLRNTSSSQPYLHIPNFSKDDVGVYNCEFAYKGGATKCEINVAIVVLPKMDAWLEHKNNTTVAVCRAERGYPAVNISWSHTGSLPVRMSKRNGLFTVESRLELPEAMGPNNLSCIISQQNWSMTLFPKFQDPPVPWLWILTAVMITVFLVGFFLFVVIKLRRYQQSDVTLSKSPPLEDVEEVEPYASYVQRVNSIYN